MKIVQDGAEASVTTRYANCVPDFNTVQFKIVVLNDVNWYVTLSRWIELGADETEGWSDGRAPKIDG